ncbi:RNA polymerase sigma factor SigZ [Azotosporobacter soli]|uniref:RNA polymerase sigma factor SigZ n=1 Tax=Azotosporobacter soli TaxID=3055040 RepID=UPI0031FE7F4B
MDQRLETVWVDFKSQLLSYIQTKVSDRYAAEDILQEVFIKVYGNIDHLASLSNLKAWLYKITYNAIIDYYRGRNAELVQINDIKETITEENESVNMNEEITACLKALLSGLPDRYRKPLELYILQNLKHKEIAEKLGISISGSKTRVQRARNKLKELLSACCRLEFDRHGNIVEYHKKKNCKCSDTCQ